MRTIYRCWYGCRIPLSTFVVEKMRIDICEIKKAIVPPRIILLRLRTLRRQPLAIVIVVYMIPRFHQKRIECSKIMTN